MKAWEETGIVCYPFLATAYPGSEWFTVYKHKILEQYDGDLEAFISDLDDATKITANISENFSTVELLGIRELMVSFDYKKLKAFEKEWWARNKTVKLPKFISKAGEIAQKTLSRGTVQMPLSTGSLSLQKKNTIGIYKESKNSRQQPSNSQPWLIIKFHRFLIF